MASAADRRLFWMTASAVVAVDFVTKVLAETSLHRPLEVVGDYVLLRLAFRSASKVLFHTEAERAAFVRDYGIPVQAELVPHRIAAQFGVVTKAEARERLRTRPCRRVSRAA